MRKITWTSRLGVVLLALVLAGCGDQETDTGSTEATPVPATAVAERVSDAPSAMNEREYDRQSRLLKDSPRRVIPPVSPEQWLSFVSTEAGATALIDAIRQGDQALADRIVASLPADERKQALRQVDEQARQLRHADDYALLWRFEQFRHYDSTQLWQLDAQLLSGRIVDAVNHQPGCQC